MNMQFNLKPLILALIVLVLSFTPVISNAQGVTITSGTDGVSLQLGDSAIKGQQGAWDKIQKETKYAISGITAIAVLISVGSLIVGFTMMGTASGNPQKLSQSKTAIMFGFIGLVGIGAVWVIAGLAFNLFASPTATP